VAEVVLGDHLHLLQDHRGDFGDRIVLVPQVDARIVVRSLDDPVRHVLQRRLDLRAVELAADQALARVDRVLGVRDRLPLRDVTDEALARLGDRDHRRRDLVPAAVRDDDRSSTLDDCDARVEGAEIDADDLLHPLPVIEP
jgi:hypothetical protein